MHYWTGIRISSKWESIDVDQGSGSEDEDAMSVIDLLHSQHILLYILLFRHHRLTSLNEQKCNSEYSEKQRRKLREVEVCDSY